MKEYEKLIAILEQTWDVAAANPGRMDKRWDTIRDNIGRIVDIVEESTGGVVTMDEGFFGMTTLSSRATTRFPKEEE